MSKDDENAKNADDEPFPLVETSKIVTNNQDIPPVKEPIEVPTTFPTVETSSPLIELTVPTKKGNNKD